MNRWIRGGLAPLLLALPLAAAAQVRNFPDAALRGTLTVVAPPTIELDGKADRLSPGARIRNPNNMLVLPGNLVGQTVLVNYTREPGGMVHEVWLLTPDEAKVKRAAAEGSGFSIRNFIFGSDAPRQPRDDGKTPYHQLPRYGQQP
jgi:hypothetical protein